MDRIADLKARAAALRTAAAQLDAQIAELEAAKVEVEATPEHTYQGVMRYVRTGGNFGSVLTPTVYLHREDCQCIRRTGTPVGSWSSVQEAKGDLHNTFKVVKRCTTSR